jgi:hypothetical protein
LWYSSNGFDRIDTVIAVNSDSHPLLTKSLSSLEIMIDVIYERKDEDAYSNIEKV